MQRRLAVWIVAGGMLALTGVALAQDKPAPAPDAILKLEEGSVGVGIGWSWGKGQLEYQGKTYKVKVDGLSVGELGVDKAKAMGKVLNLKKLEDFDGTYRQAQAGGTVGKGAALTVFHNDKGVKIEMKSETTGASLKVDVGGLKLKLEK
jgi:hypothetical protein